MKNGRQTIYRTARMSVNESGAIASEGIFVTERSLRDYETGVTVPPDDVVMRMVQHYKDPWLGYLHMKQTSPLGAYMLPDVVLPSDLREALLLFQSHRNSISLYDPQMIDITADNLVDDKELPAWKIIRGELSQMAGRALALALHPEKKSGRLVAAR